MSMLAGGLPTTGLGLRGITDEMDAQDEKKLRNERAEWSREDRGFATKHREITTALDGAMRQFLMTDDPQPVADWASNLFGTEDPLKAYKNNDGSITIEGGGLPTKTFKDRDEFGSTMLVLASPQNSAKLFQKKDPGFNSLAPGNKAFTDKGDLIAENPKIGGVGGGGYAKYNMTTVDNQIKGVLAGEFGGNYNSKLDQLFIPPDQVDKFDYALNVAQRLHHADVQRKQQAGGNPEPAGVWASIGRKAASQILSVSEATAMAQQEAESKARLGTTDQTDFGMERDQWIQQRAQQLVAESQAKAENNVKQYIASGETQYRDEGLSASTQGVKQPVTGQRQPFYSSLTGQRQPFYSPSAQEQAQAKQSPDAYRSLMSKMWPDTPADKLEQKVKQYFPDPIQAPAPTQNPAMATTGVPGGIASPNESVKGSVPSKAKTALKDKKVAAYQKLLTKLRGKSLPGGGSSRAGRPAHSALKTVEDAMPYLDGKELQEAVKLKKQLKQSLKG